MGAAFGVIYEDGAQDLSTYDLQRRGVLDDGSIVLLPSRAIGRYSLGR